MCPDKEDDPKELDEEQAFTVTKLTGTKPRRLLMAIPPPPPAEDLKGTYAKFFAALDTGDSHIHVTSAAYAATPLRQRVPEAFEGNVLGISDRIASAVLADPEVIAMTRKLHREYGFLFEMTLIDAGFCAIPAYKEITQNFLKALLIKLAIAFISHAIYYLGIDDPTFNRYEAKKREASIIAELVITEARELRARIRYTLSKTPDLYSKKITEMVEGLRKLKDDIEIFAREIPPDVNPARVQQIYDQLLNREFAGESLKQKMW